MVITRGDLDYTALWILLRRHSLAKIEVRARVSWWTASAFRRR